MVCNYSLHRRCHDVVDPDMNNQQKFKAIQQVTPRNHPGGLPFSELYQEGSSHLRYLGQGDPEQKGWVAKMGMAHGL